jgi:catechol 2,3-dioxygenase-like lactoylglutathione lyase family enzyme
MNPTDFGRLGLGPIDQVAFVVRSLEESLPRYEAIFGPFKAGESRIDDYATPEGSANCTLKLAVNNAAPIEVELIEVAAGSTPHLEHLEKHGEGLHHVRFRVDSVDESIKTLEAEGFRSVFHKRYGPTVAFAYLETPGDIGSWLVELLEMPSA